MRPRHLEGEPCAEGCTGAGTELQEGRNHDPEHSPGGTRGQGGRDEGGWHSALWLSSVAGPRELDVLGVGLPCTDFPLLVLTQC